MRKILCLLAFFAALGLCQADDYRTFTITTHASVPATAVTGYADSFTGEIDELSVYTDSGVTGTVAIAAIDPYSDDALVLATNATVTGRMVWRPRIVAPAVEGTNSLVVTNAATADRFNAHGERIRAIVSDASTSNSVFRVFVKIKN